MEYRSIPGGHEWHHETGAVIRVMDLDWSRTGRVYADLAVLTEDRSAALGGGRVELSSIRDRELLAKEVASHNGSKPEEWADALLAIFTRLQRVHVAVDPFNPVDLSTRKEPGPVQFRVEKLLPEKLATNMYGDSGQGKSTLADHLGLSVCTGKSWLGYGTAKGPVLLLDWELTEEITLGRLYRLSRGLGLTGVPQGIFYQAMTNPLGDVLDSVAAWGTENGTGLVIVDSFGPASGGDPSDQEKAIVLMNTIRNLGTTTLIIDHQGKPTPGQSYVQKRAFGPAWKGHLARSSLQLELVSSMDGRASIVLRQQKSNFAWLVETIPFHIHYTPTEIRIEMADEADAAFQDTATLPAWQRVERYLTWKGTATFQELKEECGIANDGTLNNALTELRNRGRLPKESEGGPGNKRIYQLMG